MRFTRECLNETVRRSRHEWLAYARRRTRGCRCIDPEEVVDAAIERLHRYVDQDVRNPAALLRTILRHIVSNERRRRVWFTLTIPETVVNHRRSEAEECLARAEALRALEDVFKGCIPSVRKVLEMMLDEECDKNIVAMRLLSEEGVPAPDKADLDRMKRRIDTYLDRARRFGPGPDCAA